jgi:DeoR/GlpR family transcriptional regulator of sugar metabolism
LSGALLKGERHARILDRLAATGRIVAADLEAELGVSGYTIRRDLDELASAGRLHRVHGGALPRSPVGRTYEERRGQEVAGKQAVARAAVQVLEPGQVVVLDGGSTALAVAEAIPEAWEGTVVTHAPPVAAALSRVPGAEVVVVGGVLDRRAMVCTGAVTVAAYRLILADVCFLGVWSLHPEHGITQAYPEEAEVRRVLVERADRVVGLCSRDKLGAVAPFAVAPATALTDLATEPNVPAEVLAPYAELGISVPAASRSSR